MVQIAIEIESLTSVGTIRSKGGRDLTSRGKEITATTIGIRARENKLLTHFDND